MDKFDRFKNWLWVGIESFKTDPPNTRFQKGFLAAYKQCQAEIERLEKLA